jgi:tetratricopeptide (TPR) repeat protein
MPKKTQTVFPPQPTLPSTIPFVYRRLALSGLSLFCLLLFAGCESAPPHPSSAVKSAIGVQTTFSTCIYGPFPVEPTKLAQAYCTQIQATLRPGLGVFPGITPNIRGIGQIRVQFHLKSDGTVDDFIILTNTIGESFGQAYRNAICGKHFDPWPEKMCQKRYAGYFTFRVFLSLQSETNKNFGLDPEMAAIFFQTQPTNQTVTSLADYQTGPPYLIQGLVKTSTNNFSEAIADFTKAIEFDPKDAWAWSGRGLCRIRLKDYDAAMADLAKAVELDPQNAKAWNSWSLIRRKFKDYSGVITDCSKAIDLNPDFGGAYDNRAYARKRLQDFDGALVDVNRAIALEPTNALAVTTRGGIKFALQDYENALADCVRAVELNPKSGTAYAIRGDIHQECSNQPAALESFRKAVEADPTLNYPLFHIWVMRSRTGEEEAATEELKKHFLSRSADQKDEWSYKVEAFLTGNLTEEDFLAAADGQTKTPQEHADQLCEANYYAGIKHLLAGDKEGAANLFQKCMAAGVRDFVEYSRARAELQKLQTHHDL